MKELVTKFDLEAAFKELDALEIPKAEKGIRANRLDLHETFKNSRKLRTDILLEDYYDITDTEELEQAKVDREAEVAKAKIARIEKIIDLEAESEEDLLPSYIGKVIVQCPQCMTLFYKEEADIIKSETDESVVNVNEVCQHCGNDSGYTLIGKVGGFDEEEVPTEEFSEEEFDLNLEDEVTEEESAEEVEAEGEEELDLIPEEESEEETEEVKESLTLNEDVDDETEIEDEDFLNEVEDETVEIAEEPVEEEPAEEVEEILTSVEEVKEVAEEAAEAVIEASEEEPVEDIKEITDEVVEDHFEISEEETEEEVVEDEEVIEDEESVEESLTEAVDKELDDKLKAHNEYIEYLKEMIEKEEKSLANAKNDFVKKSIQSRIDALKADLEAALPEALKGEVETELPTPEEADLEAVENKEEAKEEVKENLTEGLLKEESADDFDITNKEFEELLDAFKNESLEKEEKEEEVVEENADLEEAYDVTELANSEYFQCLDLTTAELRKIVRIISEDLDIKAEELDVDRVIEYIEDGGGFGLFAIDNCNLEHGRVSKELLHKLILADPKMFAVIKAYAEQQKLLYDHEGKPLPYEVSDKTYINAVLDLTTPEDLDETVAYLHKLYKEMFPEELEETFKDIEETDDEAIEKCITESLKNVYSNVKDFNLTNCTLDKNAFIVEGNINFKSGHVQKTAYVFTEAKRNEDSIILKGINEDLAATEGTFELHTTLKESKLIAENLTYKYYINETLVEGLGTSIK